MKKKKDDKNQIIQPTINNQISQQPELNNDLNQSIPKEEPKQANLFFGEEKKEEKKPATNLFFGEEKK